jgi:DNA-binding NarL/FixJ family response regulator
LGTTVKKILLVEDNPGDVMLVMRQLDSLAAGEFEVLTVHCVRDGIEALLHTEFDALLLDLFLPDAWGLQAIADFYKANPLLPILVLTGYYDDRTTLHAIRLGAAEYLCKDNMDWEALVKALRRLTDHKSDGSLEPASKR